MNHAQRPAQSWAQYLAANPDTKHDHVTYCAGQFARSESGKALEVGDVFRNDGTSWRIVKICGNPFAPVLAVPAIWPQNYWGTPQ